MTSQDLRKTMRLAEGRDWGFDGGFGQSKDPPKRVEADGWEIFSQTSQFSNEKKGPFHSRLCQQNDRKYPTLCFRFFSPK